MRKKMRVHSGSKHKVMSALAAVSGLGDLGGRKRSGSDKITYEVDLKTKDLLSTDKLVALAVAKAAIDQLKVSTGEGLTSDERREVERAVSSLVSGKTYRPSNAKMSFKLDFSGGTGAQALSIVDKEGVNMKIAEQDGLRNLVVCPNNFKGRQPKPGKSGTSTEKARHAGRYAAQVLYSLLNTGLNTKKRKVSRLDDSGKVVEQFRMFLGPVGGSKEAKMELPADRCYRIEIDDKLRAAAFKNTFLAQSSAVSSDLQDKVRAIVESVKGGYSNIGLSQKDIDREIARGEAPDLNGLGQMDVPGEDLSLNGMRRRRRKGSKRKTASARRRKSPAKRKATRRRKAKK